MGSMSDYAAEQLALRLDLIRKGKFEKGDDSPENRETGALEEAGIHWIVPLAPEVCISHYNKIEMYGKDCKELRDLIVTLLNIHIENVREVFVKGEEKRAARQCN